MPTIADLYRSLKEHEEISKTAAVKKTAIESTHAPGQTGVAAALEDVLGSNVAETKVRIKKKLEDVAGVQKAQEGLGAHPEESPSQSQAPIVGDKMPPGGDKGTAAPAGLSGKLSAHLEKTEEKAAKHDDKCKKGMPPAFLKHKKAGEEVTEEEKIAAEHYAAGQIIAQGFVDELSRLMGAEAK